MAAYAEVERFREAIERVMADAHRMVQTDERAGLEAEGPERLAALIHLDDAVNMAAEHILHTLALSQWPTLKDYFARPETRKYFHDVLHSDFHHTAWIERSWAAASAESPPHPNLSWHEPDHPAVKAFRGFMAGQARLDMPHPDDEGQDVVRLSPLDEHGGREMVEAIHNAAIPGPKE